MADLHEELLDADPVAVNLALTAAGEVVRLCALVRASGSSVDEA